MAAQKKFFVVAAIAALIVSMAFSACSTTQSPERQVDDLGITTAVKSKLASDVGASTVTNVDVNTTNGVVTLAGQVSDESVRIQVEQVARAVAGVVGVNNNLQVETQVPQMPPQTAAERPR